MDEESLGIVFGTIISAEKVKGTERLHIIKIDVGDKVLQIATGVPGDFPEGYLIGKQVPIKIDVPTIKVRGIESQARFITTTGEGNKTILIIPEKKVPNGSKVW